MASVLALAIAISAPATAGPAKPERIWTIVPNERVHSDERLFGVAAISEDEAWAVGNRVSGAQQTRPVIKHWDGGAWRAVASAPTRPLGLGFFTLLDVAGTSADDVWGVGAHSSGADTDPLIEHWNGTKWKLVQGPETGFQVSGLAAIEALATFDVWAVGAAYGPHQEAPFVEHWDGRTWSVVPTPADPDTYVEEFLQGISAASPEDIWAVGRRRRTWEGPSTPFALHWDGEDWSGVPMPHVGPGGGELHAVAAVSSTDAWAVGGWHASETNIEPLLEHWDGASWSVVSAPSRGIHSSLAGVVALSSTDVWAAGDYFVKDVGLFTMVQHWNGRRWRIVPSPNPMGGGGQTIPALFDDIDGLDSAQLWAVGRMITNNDIPLVERYGVPFCSDGMDNDGDGRIDYPGDDGCTSPTEGSEFATARCDNGYDGDDDGLIDFPQDPGCDSRSDESERGTAQCDDGLDNDLDGKVDYRADGRGDPQCTSPADIDEST